MCLVPDALHVCPMNDVKVQKPLKRDGEQAEPEPLRFREAGLLTTYDMQVPRSPFLSCCTSAHTDRSTEAGSSYLPRLLRTCAGRESSVFDVGVTIVGNTPVQQSLLGLLTPQMFLQSEILKVSPLLVCVCFFVFVCDCGMNKLRLVYFEINC